MNARTNDDLMGLAERLVAYGRSKGAAEVEVGIQETTRFSVNIREQNVERLTEAGNLDLGMRVFVDGKLATAGSQDMSEETLLRLTDNAIARARLGGVDPHAGLPDLQEVRVKSEDLKVFDPAIPALTPEEKIAAAKKAEAIGLADKRIKVSTGAIYNSVAANLYLANSKGFAGSHKRTFVVLGAGFQAGEGDNLLQDGWYQASTSAAGLPSPEEIAKKAVERVTRLIGARKVESQNVPVVFEAPVTGSLLLGFLAQCVSGPALDRRQTFLLDKLGQKIGSGLIAVYDDGLLPGGQGTTPFDAEGVPARKTTVMENGVLKSYLLNTYYGRKLKMASTGNAGGTTNFYMAAGTSKPADIIKSVDKGLLLTGTIGFGLVPTTGDISTGAFGLWIEKGEVAFPVAEITISGNLSDVLKGIDMVGDDLDLSDTIAGPTVKTAVMSIGGKGAAK
jgi:PmbA protein